MLTRSPWPKRRSSDTPGICDIASATLVLGNLPMSSAVIASDTVVLLRLVSSDFSRLARMPTTVTVSSSVASLVVPACGRSWSVASCAWAWALKPKPRQATIAADSADLRYVMVSLPSCVGLAGADCVVPWRWCRPMRCDGRRGPRWPLLRLRSRSVPGQVPAGRADHAQLSVLDQFHRDAFERFAHRP